MLPSQLIRASTVLITAGSILLSGCADTELPLRTGLEATQSISEPSADRASSSQEAGARGHTRSQDLILNRGGNREGPLFEDQGDTVTLNLVDVPIPVAAKAILSDILKKNFTVADNVSGTITLQTTSPTSKQALVESFEAVLKTRGFGISLQGDSYAVGTLDPGQSVQFSDGRSIAVGKQARIVPLAHVSATEMERILKAVSPQGVLRADPQRNIIIITGSSSDLKAMQDAISLFDVDWMRHSSAAVVKLESGAEPAAIAKQLDTLFASGSGSVAEGTVRFVPSRELNAILVISTNEAMLERARGVIRRIDGAAAEETAQTFIYKVENRTAKELASIIQASLSGRSSTGEGTTTASTPISGAMPATAGTPDTTEPAAEGAESALSSLTSGKISVVADETNNSLVINCSKREYERMLPMVTRLDRMPSQVLIEAVIAEATLDDNLKFGLRYSIGAGNFFQFTNDDNGRVPDPNSPGFTYALRNTDFRVVLNTISKITDVKVVSSPTLTVLDNHTARLQIGDQVPTVSESRQSQDTSTVSTTRVEMKDTGVILKVTPRVSSNGHILLNIDQEVSDVVNTTTSGIDSPTIRQRKVSSTVVVADGQSIVIGGLVQEKHQLNHTAVPLVSEIPVVGSAFRSRDDVVKRTELMIFIRTRLMSDEISAQTITDEFRAGIDAVDVRSEPVRRDVRQQLKRMIY